MKRDDPIPYFEELMSSSACFSFSTSWKVTMGPKNYSVCARMPLLALAIIVGSKNRPSPVSSVLALPPIINDPPILTES